MEFTPKKATAFRHDRCTSEGKTYLTSFHRRRKLVPDVTPPRKFGFASTIENKKPLSFRKVDYSQSNHILQNSQFQNNLKKKDNCSPKESQKSKSSKENANPGLKRFLKVDTKDSSKIRKKWPLKDVHSILDTSIDQFNVFSDEEEEDDSIFLSSKHEKMSKCLNKENDNLNSHAPIHSSRVNANVTPKRKYVNIRRSSLLHDISPQKVKLAFNLEKKNVNCNDAVNSKVTLFEEKENLSLEKKERNYPQIEHPHMIGFPNFGNTCYLNAVIQTLVSLQPFVVDLNSIIERGVVPVGSVTHSLWNIIVARQKLDSTVLKPSLRTLKENVEKIDGSFSGFKMQDANEFLMQMLDMVKDEISKFTSQTSSDYEDESLKTENKTLLDQKTYKNVKRENNINTYTSTNLFGSQSSSCTSDKCTSIFDTPSSSSPLSSGKVKDHFIDDDDDEIFLTQRVKNILRNSSNPVIMNFEFELLESFRCLGCGETEGRKQKHFALYVDLPEEGNETIQKAVEAYMDEDHRDLTCEKCKYKKASFLTSFLQVPRVLIVQMKRYEYKPKQNESIKVSSKVDVNIWLHLDRLTTKDTNLPHKYLAESMRKEFRYNCSPPSSSQTNPPLTPSINSENCVKTNIKSDFTTPSKKIGQSDAEEVIIHNLEEAEDANQKIENSVDKEEEEFQKAIKLSLQDIGTYISYDRPAQETDHSVLKVQDTGNEEKNGKHSYHLISVISHFGLTTCTGHYVADVLNIEEDQWYHYDDEAVSPLPESVVLSEGRQKNGYIFFYIHRDIYCALRSNET